MKSRLLSLVLALTCCAVYAAPVGAQGLPGATVHAEGKAERDAMKSRMQERCKENPQQCEEMKAKCRGDRSRQCVPAAECGCDQQNNKQQQNGDRRRVDLTG